MDKYGEFGENLDLVMSKMGSLANAQFSRDGWDIPVARVDSFQVAETGHNTVLDIYYPEGIGPFPTVVYIHGGAFIGGFNKMDQGTCRQICHDTGCAVISPNYVLAPQHQWPASLDEMYALIKFFIKNAEKYNLDMSKLAVGGNSAGSSLAAQLCVKVAQTKEFSFKCALLTYPGMMINEEAKLSDEFTDTEVLNLETVEMIRNFYVPKGEDSKNPLISAFYADPSCFPPVVIFSGRRDPLYFGQKEFADKLMAAGKEVMHLVYEGVPHGFFEVTGWEETARECKDVMSTLLKRYMK